MSTIGISLYYLFDILSWVIVIRSFMTWLPNGGGKFYDILSTITESKWTLALLSKDSTVTVPNGKS